MHIYEENDFQFIDEGEGEPLVLLHGLFGALSNWTDVVDRFSSQYRVLIPLLPIHTMRVKQASLEKLNEFVEAFVSFKRLEKFNLAGNSLGGHIGLIYTLRNIEKVKRLILTGSSGLFEDAMGGSYPRRGSYDYVSERVAYTFYNPAIATKELIDEVFKTLKNVPKCLRIVGIAKSAQRHNMANEIPRITTPTLLVWGLNDTITPPRVAHEFNRLLPNSTLQFIDKCCHAPMMEQPDRFNELLEAFLAKSIPR